MIVLFKLKHQFSKKNNSLDSNILPMKNKTVLCATLETILALEGKKERNTVRH